MRLHPEQNQPHPAPADQGVYRLFIAGSLLLATLVGFLLAIHVPAGRLLGYGSPERTADLIQAHGQVQLLGFAGLYVMGMSLRLLPRFAGARLALPSLVPLVLWLMTVSLLLRAVAMPWFSGDLHDVILVASSFGVLLSAACFLLVVIATLGYEARHPDASGLAFAFGALMLFAATAVTAWGAIDSVADGRRALSYLTNTAVLQLELSGFLLLFIFGVALRALPPMMGLERPRRGARFLPVALAVSVAAFSASLLYLEFGSFSGDVARLAAAALLLFGLTVLLFVWQAGVLRPEANRIRPSSQSHLWLVRGAFFWLVVAGLLSIYAGVSAWDAAELPSQADFDAVRHALGAGVVTSLILGMSLMILPEFAIERQRPNLQRRLAISLALLVNTAALLRVLPSLPEFEWTADERNALMAAAGSLAELAVFIFTVYVLRLFWRAARELPAPSVAPARRSAPER